MKAIALLTFLSLWVLTGCTDQYLTAAPLDLAVDAALDTPQACSTPITNTVVVYVPAAVSDDDEEAKGMCSVRCKCERSEDKK